MNILHLLLVLVAIVCFALAAFGVPARVNLVASGLLFWLVSTLT